MRMGPIVLDDDLDVGSARICETTPKPLRQNTRCKVTGGGSVQRRGGP